MDFEKLADGQSGLFQNVVDGAGFKILVVQRYRDEIGMAFFEKNVVAAGNMVDDETNFLKFPNNNFGFNDRKFRHFSKRQRQPQLPQKLDSRTEGEDGAF